MRSPFSAQDDKEADQHSELVLQEHGHDEQAGADFSEEESAGDQSRPFCLPTEPCNELITFY
jgi:hypothetical protein